MPEEWLIDGCNLFFALHVASPPERSRSDRHALILGVADFASRLERPVLMVLDGSGSQAELDIYHTAFFRVVYSQKISADSFIERILFERRAEAQFMVVTNDRAISNMARGGGAGVMSTSQFLERMRGSQKDSADEQEKGRIKSHGFHRPFKDKLKDL